MSDYEKAMQLAKTGLGGRTIARMINRPCSTVYNWIRNRSKPYSEWDETKLREFREAGARAIKGKGGSKKGRKFTEEHKRKLAESKWGEKNPMWKGDEASVASGCARARRMYDAPEKHDIHHIDGNTLNNAPDNILILKRRKHMEKDGRLSKMIERNKS